MYSIQELEFDRCANLQRDVSTTKIVILVYTDRHTNVTKSTQLITLIIYMYILRGFLLGVKNCVANLTYPVKGINSRKETSTKKVLIKLLISKTGIFHESNIKLTVHRGVSILPADAD